MIDHENFLNYTSVLENIIRVDQVHFPWPWSLNSWREYLNKNNFYCSALCDQNDILGFCLFNLNKLESLGHLLKIVVTPTNRGSGIGKVLHRSTEKRLAFAGVKKLHLEVETSNMYAIKMYNELGYLTLVRKKQFYSDGTDAVVMQKKLF